MSDSPRRFFLTGCASGIGQHLAAALLARGHRVWATDIAQAELEGHARAHLWPADRVTLRRLDVTDADAWERVYEEAIVALGGIDVHMNIAGYLQPAWICDAEVADVHRHLDINTKGVIFGTRLAARHMCARGEGHIINVASLASLSPVPGLALYCASKYAVRGFSLAAAVELREHGVHVTTVCPDGVKTPMVDKQLDREEAALTFSGARLLTVEDVAAAILDRALVRKPMQLSLPRSRALLARLADLAPSLGLRARPLLMKLGRRRQQLLTRRRATK
ncbi:MAG: SDR family oxidoreductase [Myxococcales bacterium]|nr:SDR family oxidoreductase [Myxococcales bacterium]